MKRELTIEALIGPDDGLLIQMTQALRAMTLSPESFVWSVMPKTEEARVWMIVAVEEAKLRELVAEFGKIPGVRRVIIYGPGQSILEALAISKMNR